MLPDSVVGDGVVEEVCYCVVTCAIAAVAVAVAEWAAGAAAVVVGIAVRRLVDCALADWLLGWLAWYVGDAVVATAAIDAEVVVAAAVAPLGLVVVAAVVVVVPVCQMQTNSNKLFSSCSSHCCKLLPKIRDFARRKARRMRLSKLGEASPIKPISPALALDIFSHRVRILKKKKKKTFDHEVQSAR